MKVLIAMDSWKGSLSSAEAAQAVKSGILQSGGDYEIVIKALADGGEGTVKALTSEKNGRIIETVVTGPLGDKRKAVYGVLKDGKTAVIEMAEAAGLALVPRDKRNPLYTTTYGVGELIKEAVNCGYRNFIIGLGGSSTNDGGVGMLQALGFEFFDEDGAQLGLGGQVLGRINNISIENRIKELDQCTFRVACDVDNPLYGVDGAAYVFGPQKGATNEIVKELDKGLVNYSQVVKRSLGIDIGKSAGTGAAGGLGYAFMAFLNGKLESGIKIIMEEIKLEDEIKNSDIVVTGEGRIDSQTEMGKAPWGVAKLAKKHGIKVIAMAGSVTGLRENSYMDGCFSVIQSPISLEDAMKKENAIKNIEITAREIFRLISTFN